MGLKDNLVKKVGKSYPKMYIKLKMDDTDLAHDTIEAYDIIRENNLFDDEFYLENYPKLKNTDLDLLLHYIFFGFDEGKNPNSYFDGVFYKNHYKDASKSKLNPLVHYALYGMSEKRQIAPGKADLTVFNSDKDNILYILHEKIGTVGGASFSNLDIIRNLPGNFKPFILTSKDNQIELWTHDPSLEKIANWNISSAEELDEIYDEILSKLNIAIVHINHLINHSFSLISKIKEKEIPYIVNIHDFYYICPSIHLIDENYNFCNFNCSNCSYDIENWQNNFHSFLKDAKYIIAPSNSVINLYKEIYPDLNNFKLIEHGRNLKKAHNLYTVPDGKVKIVVPGHISPHKGSYLIAQIKDLDLEGKIEFHFVGTQIPNLKAYGETYGRYQREEFNCIISKIKPSYVAILSTCPETYSYTLTESWAARIPVIATNLGALKERIEKTGGGWVLDYTSPSDIYDSILNISKEDYLEKIENISKIEFKTVDEMVYEYNEIYKELS